MAHLEVEPKRANPWWIWLIAAIVALVIIVLLARGCNNDSTKLVANDSTAMDTIAVTQPDWNSVDFNSPLTTDPDITDKDIAVGGNDQYTIYSLGENILFSTDGDSIHSAGEQKLSQIKTALNNRYKNAMIGVYGNTDSTGTVGHNKQLGAERAAAVKDWLIKNGNLSADRVTIHSLGESKPVATNKTADGRAQNRNVSIVAFANQ
ncbi:OmpA family protein [Pedobacter sp.]|uniref:OmpA family protein n=1 Tax=Pedobacter sp. TaxID=1411316 RepID=UPI003D7F7706